VCCCAESAGKGKGLGWYFVAFSMCNLETGFHAGHAERNVAYEITIGRGRRQSQAKWKSFCQPFQQLFDDEEFNR